MHLGNRYNSLTRLVLWSIRENKIYAHICSRTAVYFERFSVVLGYSPKASCTEHLLVTKANFLRKCALNLSLGIFSISETNRIKDNTVSTWYVSLNFDRKFNRKKSHNSLFFRYKTQRTRNVLKALQACIN